MPGRIALMRPLRLPIVTQLEALALRSLRPAIANRFGRLGGSVTDRRRPIDRRLKAA